MMGVLKILGMLTLFGLDWLYENLHNAYVILCILILAVALMVIFRD